LSFLTEISHDEVFLKARERHLITVSFLTAIKSNMDSEKAFQAACDGFAHYMTKLYEQILSTTKAGSQKRFDKFRDFYEQYAKKSSYIKIIESSDTSLKVHYYRCPFAEVMAESGLEDLSYAFCLSDYAFTNNVLPGVEFNRTHEIIKGDDFCDHAWLFIKTGEY